MNGTGPHSKESGSGERKDGVPGWNFTAMHISANNPACQICLTPKIEWFASWTADSRSTGAWLCFNCDTRRGNVPTHQD